MDLKKLREDIEDELFLRESPGRRKRLLGELALIDVAEAAVDDGNCLLCYGENSHDPECPVGRLQKMEG